ncbi:hypothetical protein Asp14428_48830 [Actinoplanes sp. NBRC 14428]|nr:hypothetical protein Asp14428_48830 [Actinoplanes sp. NBRC 14428]
MSEGLTDAKDAPGVRPAADFTDWHVGGRRHVRCDASTASGQSDLRACDALLVTSPKPRYITRVSEQRPSKQERDVGLAEAFKAWWAIEDDPIEYVSNGLIVLDANVLLHLYRVTPATRDQIFAALERLRDRLWIPHQAALEFHRNRIDVVTGRMSLFSSTRQALNQAAGKAASELRNAVSRFLAFRQLNMTERDWEPRAYGLDDTSIASRLDGIMDSALAELRVLEDEHDIGPRDVRTADGILQRLEEVTRGRVGPPYEHSRLIALVNEAIDFRFPNQIPPGYEDLKSKPLAYRAAGDYILWRQILDRSALAPRPNKIAIVTNDVKEDWWVLDRRGQPDRARPEIKQEIFEFSGTSLALMTLSGFLEAAASNFPGSVSPDTVEEVRTSVVTARLGDLLHRPGATVDTTIEDADRKPDLLSLDVAAFEYLVRQLLEAMGYSNFMSAPATRSSVDFVATSPSSGVSNDLTLIVAKRYKNIVGSDQVRALYGEMNHFRAEFGMIITTGWFGNSSKEFAAGKGITLIEGRQLLDLLREFLGIDASISAVRPGAADDR